MDDNAIEVLRRIEFNGVALYYILNKNKVICTFTWDEEIEGYSRAIKVGMTP